MSAAQLLLWITAALLLQAAVGVGVAVWRRRGLQVLSPLREALPAAPRADAAWTGWRPFRVARREPEDPAQSQCSFYLVPVDGQPLPAFKPGQFLTFALDVPVDGATREITRCYSLSDRPDPGHYRVTIKRVPAPADMPGVPPGVSSNHFHDHVHEGDVLRLKPPAGHFVIDPDAAVPVVLVGGGIGITPMMSMLRWCLDEQPARSSVHLYYGLRHSGEQAFKALLEAWAAAHANFHLNVVYSRPGAGDVAGRDFQHHGHVNVELLRRTLPHGRHQFYVCGPPAMMQALVPALAEWGVARADLHFEAFGPATVHLPGDEVPAADASATFEVRFRRAGRSLTWDGADASLLDFAERHGVDVLSGCRSGGCGTCETRLVEGEVRYAHAPDHDVTPGHCLLCVGRPASALVLEA